MSPILPRLWPLVFVLAALPAYAQPANRPPPKIDFRTALGIDADTAQALDQVLREQHQKREALHAEHEAARAKMDALRAETDKKLAALLSAAQIRKLHELRPPRPDRPPPPPPP